MSHRDFPNVTSFPNTECHVNSNSEVAFSESLRVALQPDKTSILIPTHPQLSSTRAHLTNVHLLLILLPKSSHPVRYKQRVRASTDMIFRETFCRCKHTRDEYLISVGRYVYDDPLMRNCVPTRTSQFSFISPTFSSEPTTTIK